MRASKPASCKGLPSPSYLTWPSANSHIWDGRAMRTSDDDDDDEGGMRKRRGGRTDFMMREGASRVHDSFINTSQVGWRERKLFRRFRELVEVNAKEMREKGRRYSKEVFRVKRDRKERGPLFFPLLNRKRKWRDEMLLDMQEIKPTVVALSSEEKGYDGKRGTDERFPRLFQFINHSSKSNLFLHRILSLEWKKTQRSTSNSILSFSSCSSFSFALIAVTRMPTDEWRVDVFSTRVGCLKVSTLSWRQEG